jgi:hypothetical protein
MVVIAAVGAQQAWAGNYLGLLWWLLLPFSSPRIVGECAYFLGRLSAFWEREPGADDE